MAMVQNLMFKPSTCGVGLKVEFQSYICIVNYSILILMDILNYIAIVSPSGKATQFLITYFWFSFYFPKHDIYKIIRLLNRSFYMQNLVF